MTARALVLAAMAAGLGGPVVWAQSAPFLGSEARLVYVGQREVVTRAGDSAPDVRHTGVSLELYNQFPILGLLIPYAMDESARVRVSDVFLIGFGGGRRALDGGESEARWRWRGEYGLQGGLRLDPGYLYLVAGIRSDYGGRTFLFNQGIDGYSQFIRGELHRGPLTVGGGVGTEGFRTLTVKSITRDGLYVGAIYERFARERSGAGRRFDETVLGVTAGMAL